MNFKQFLSILLSISLISTQTLFAGGIEIDNTASKTNRPSLTAAPNSIPIINIVKPNSQGLSHNKFKSFSVEKQGLILNNSNTAVKTKLSGFISFNPNLKGSHAKLILNEVTGTSKTLLNGFTEVAGKSADVIVANPNGISVNGGGFINTPKVTLTTGSPLITNGLLKGFDVKRGDISIEGKGFNANNIDKVALYSKALHVNAKFYAKSLDIITGSNQVNYDGSYTSKDKTTSGVSIDSSLLGGIYANTITLVSSDKGVGVNLPSEVLTQDSLSMTANGDITLQKTVASNKISINSSNAGVNLLKNITANEISIKSKKDISIKNSSVVNALDQFSIYTLGSLNNEGEISSLDGIKNSTIEVAQDIINSGLMAGYDLNIYSKSIYNTGAIYSKNTLGITAQTLNNSKLIMGNKNINLIIKDKLNNRKEGTIYADGTIIIKANEAKQKINSVINEGTIESNKNIEIDAKTLTNQADAPTIKDSSTSSSQQISRGGSNDYDLVEKTTKTQQVITPTTPALILANKDIAIEAQTLNNLYSLIAANGDITLNANIIDNAGKILLTTLTTITQEYRDERYCSSSFLGICFNHKHRAAYRGTFTNTKTSKVPLVNYGIQAKNSITGNVVTLFNSSSYITSANDGLYKTDTNNGLSLSPNITSNANSQVIIDNIVLPKGKYGQFIVNKNPSYPYLIEANPLYVNYSTFISSDYMISRLNLNPQDIQKHLGDAMYETKLIRDSVIRLSGKRYLDGYSSDLTQFKSLMDNAISVKDDLKLSFGITLTKEQISRLDKNIVWMVTKVIDGQTLLVPKLYLSSNHISMYGSNIAANNINFNIQNRLVNNGNIVANNNMQMTANDIENIDGTIKANNNILLYANNNIDNLSSTIQSGGDMYMIAGKDIKNSTISNNKTYKYSKGKQSETILGNQASILSNKNIDIKADGNIIVYNGLIKANKDLSMTSNTKAVVVSSLEKKGRYSFNLDHGYNKAESSTNLSSTIQANNINIKSNSLYIKASSIKAKENLQVNTKQDITLSSAQDREYSDFKHEVKGGLFGGGSKQQDTKDTTIQIKSLLKAKNITLNANKINQIASDIQALNAKVTTNILNLISKKDTNYENHFKQTKGFITQTSSSKGHLKDKAVASTLQTQKLILNNKDITDKLKPIENTTKVKLNQELNQNNIIKTVSSEYNLNQKEINQVKAILRDKKWNESHTSLTTVGAIIVAIVVTAITAGVGTGETVAGVTAAQTAATATAATAAATGTTVATAAAATAASALTTATIEAATINAVTAGITTQLVTSAITGESFKLDVNSLIKGAVTAGVLSYATPALNSTLHINKSYTNLNFSNKIEKAMTDSTLKAGVSSAVYGSSFKKDFLSSLGTQTQTGLSNYIGDSYYKGDTNYFEHKLSHALSGGIGAAIAGKDIVSGALGALSGEIIGEGVANKLTKDSIFSKRDKITTELTSQLGTLFIAKALNKDMQSAVDSSKVAVDNNIILHIPGTFSSKKDVDKKFKKALEKFYNDKIEVVALGKNGEKPLGNNKKDRNKLANKVVKEIVNILKKNKNEPIRLTGHSHGGNVQKLVTQKLAKKGYKNIIDDMMFLGTPVRDDYSINYKVLKPNAKILNIYDRSDLVQIHGGYNGEFSPLPILGEYGTAKQIINNHKVKNIKVEAPSTEGLIGDHMSLDSKNVIKQIK